MDFLEASMAATIVYALVPASEFYPGFNAELVDAKTYLEEYNPLQENDHVELRWPMIMEFVAGGHAYARIKKEQVAEGWLPPRRSCSPSPRSSNIRDSMEFNIHPGRHTFANVKATGRSVQYPTMVFTIHGLCIIK
ncbi:hypothetical protein POJ06DRAFT_268943 [Lipomyces tetrasporus]|uniref:Uncharacterized protein n=1 Tax=Lipomyces tetrasporus TaxID=54092 RepID=A0AAD7QRH9_9ASCO|nr:uncharacterized protein POJ06DRAFT_268943 [Lipomyces tetrasporus]KAJ8100070.1 hypothetical protein POJ06DRAFT_268943 [Lipomyces tetrasporus]